MLDMQNAGGGELLFVSCGQVKAPTGAFTSKRAPPVGECISHGARHVVAYDVAAGANGRAEGGNEVTWLSAKGAPHGFDCSMGHALSQPTPTGMDQSEGMPDGVEQQDRLAVGEAEHQAEAGCRCHQPIRGGKPAAAVLSRHNGHLVPMHLVSGGDAVGRQLHEVIDASVILRDRRGVIANVAAHVQRGKWGLTYATEPREHGMGQVLGRQTLESVDDELATYQTIHRTYPYSRCTLGV
jgi:hypothetical protein